MIIVQNTLVGCWCWKCGHHVHEDEQCIIITEKRRGTCLRTWQEGRHTLGESVCGNGHPSWIATASKVIERTWCRMCVVEKTKIGIERHRQFVKGKGGKVLSTEYVNVSTNLHGVVQKDMTGGRDRFMSIWDIGTRYVQENYDRSRNQII
jgi:hypothetical protein